MRRLAGVVFLLVPVLLIWLSVAVYDKTFTSAVIVTLRTGTAGNEMHPHADVKLRGVVVGEVRRISADGGGATLTLAIQPDKVRLLPRDVSARMLPTTLFGQRYVALIPPANPGAARLTQGSVIDQDHSADAIELQQVLDHLMPLLNDVRPAELSVTLSAVADALRGRGGELGDTVVRLEAYLAKINPSVPALADDLRELARVADTYTAAAPDLVQALDDLASADRTIAAERDGLGRLYSGVTATSGEFTAFLRKNSATIIRLSADSRPPLELLAGYAPEYPCLLANLSGFVPVMDKVLGKGTAHPGLHAEVRAVASKGAYRPGRDRPVYDAKAGPRCYPGTATTAALTNSRAENELVNELTAAGTGAAPGVLPDWSSVLAGPLFRGAEVTLR